MIAYERRAATVLFNLVLAHPVEGPFLLPANVCPIVPMTLLKAGRAFELIDISQHTLCIDPHQLVQRFNTPGTKPAGLVFVRTYGAMFDMSAPFKAVRHACPDVLLIDDRCLCPPEFDDVPSSEVSAVLYSTGYGKVVDLGFGGVGVLNPDTPYSRTATSFKQGDLDKLTANYKECIQAGSRFEYVDSKWLACGSPEVVWDEYRRLVAEEAARALEIKNQINCLFGESIPQGIQFPKEFQTWRFNLNIQDSAALLADIRDAGLFASSHYQALGHMFPSPQTDTAETLSRHVVNLFNDRYMGFARARKLTDVLSRSLALTPGPLFK